MVLILCFLCKTHFTLVAHYPPRSAFSKIVVRYIQHEGNLLAEQRNSRLELHAALVQWEEGVVWHSWGWYNAAWRVALWRMANRHNRGHFPDAPNVLFAPACTQPYMCHNLYSVNSSTLHKFTIALIHWDANYVSWEISAHAILKLWRKFSAESIYPRENCRPQVFTSRRAFSAVFCHSIARQQKTPDWILTSSLANEVLLYY